MTAFPPSLPSTLPTRHVSLRRSLSRGSVLLNYYLASLPGDEGEAAGAVGAVGDVEGGVEVDAEVDVEVDVEVDAEVEV